MITRFEATLALNPDKLVYQDGEPHKIYVNNVLVTDFIEIDKKVKELNSQEPLRLLREERNRRLAETDWTQNRDITLSNDSDWKIFRQALRDLPSTAKPQLDENGQLTNVTWPTKPT